MEEVRAAFLCNRAGEVCIAFDDPAYVQSESILIDPQGHTIHAVLHEGAWLLGPISEAMLEAFAGQKETLLTAIKPDGSIFEMRAPINTAHHSQRRRA